MESHPFDEVARIWAGSVSRRRLGVGLLGVMTVGTACYWWSSAGSLLTRWLIAEPTPATEKGRRAAQESADTACATSERHLAGPWERWMDPSVSGCDGFCVITVSGAASCVKHFGYINDGACPFRNQCVQTADCGDGKVCVLLPVICKERLAAFCVVKWWDAPPPASTTPGIEPGR